MELSNAHNQELRLSPAVAASPTQAFKKLAFFLLTVFCVAIPGFASIKAALILFVWTAFVLFSSTRLLAVFWFLSVMLSLGMCSEIALLRGVPLGDFSNHLSRLFLFFLVLGVGAYVARSNIFDTRDTDRLILVVAVISAVLKVAILSAIASGRASFGTVQSAIGFESVTDSIGFGIQRLQFPSDILLIFLLVCYSGRRRFLDILFLLSTTISVFLSFSRYLFVAYILCLIIRFLRQRRFDLISGSALTIGVLLIAVFSVSLSTRFAGNGTKVSDNIRTEQSRYLLAAFNDHPLLGSGIGSSVNGYKRSESIPFSYEIEWYAMAMQLGLIGLTWFLLNLVAPLVHCVRSRRNQFFLACIFIVWVIGGFTNPFLVSLGSAFGLAILIITLATPNRAIPKQPEGLGPLQK